jgi:hypothetical protein
MLLISLKNSTTKGLDIIRMIYNEHGTNRGFSLSHLIKSEVKMRTMWIVILLAMSASAQDESKTVVQQLDQITKEYGELQIEGKIEMLVSLDARLRSLICEPWKRTNKSFDGKLWKPTWSAIGVYVSHYGDDLGYSGKLLVEAHHIDPSSAYRRSTLFSAIMGETSSSGLGEMPDPQAAIQYLKEFPDGPFADETSIILANFYNDLFKVLKDLQGNEPRGYKYECFSKYIKSSSLAEQADEARRLSILYYSQAQDLRTQSKSDWNETKVVRSWMRQMEQGNPDGWHFCAD